MARLPNGTWRHGWYEWTLACELEAAWRLYESRPIKDWLIERTEEVKRRRWLGNYQVTRMRMRLWDRAIASGAVDDRSRASRHKVPPRYALADASAPQPGHATRSRNGTADTVTD